ncbi:DUF317 domain-containing protein [Streptomyces sp. YIM 98790]|uniref:DUF317 domain-containing protein n=1 Tax=Streptomyces sp. YIM 98790 TaxID=2689077 RepID=UPI00140A8F57|nr:DUF317 domain-containing protein [Streptomyces sp. YIM 98790]
MNRRPSGTGTGEELPQPRSLIAPRHLAGTGEIRHITDFLRAANWRERTSRSGGPLVFESPDHAVRIGYTADTIPPQWILSGRSRGPHSPAWHATLGAQCPVEIVAAVSDALAAPPLPQDAAEVWRPLDAHGWTTSSEPGRHHTATSADATAVLRYRKDGDSAVWWACATPPGERWPLWNAVFSQHTPPHLLAAFAAALADARPVLRAPGTVPAPAVGHVRAAPVWVPAAELTAAQRARRAAGRAAAYATAWAGRAWSVHRPRTGIPRPLARDDAPARGRR